MAMNDATWQARTRELAARYGLAEPPSSYVGFEAPCWSCGKRSPVFLWPGIKDWAVPPEPAPATVKPRFSQALRVTYPSNGCIHCDVLFGDNFLPDLILNYVDYDEGAELMDRFLNDIDP